MQHNEKHLFRVVFSRFISMNISEKFIHFSNSIKK